MIFGKFLTAPRFLTFTRFPKLICPNLLCHSQISSTKFTWHSSFNFSSSIYTFSGVLGVIPTNFPLYSLLISHFLELKMQKCPYPQVWLTLDKLGFSFSTSSTFLVLSFPKLTVPFPSMLLEALSSNVTLPFCFFKSKNLFLLPVICFEHPLSTYQRSFLS
jgi:hypothetical protein